MNLVETPDIDSSTEDYAKRFAGPAGQWLLDVQKNGTLQLLNGIAKCSKVLDVGGGHGQNIDVMLQKRFDPVVFGSSDQCQLLIRRYVEEKRVRFVTGNLLALPFEDGSFDCCLSYRMLTHLRQWELFVSELCRVSSKSIVVDFPTFRSVNCFSEIFFSFKKKIEKNTRRYQIFHENEVVEAFRKNGFEPVERFPQFFFPMALHRLIQNKTFSRSAESVARCLLFTSLFGSPVLYRFDKR